MGPAFEIPWGLAVTGEMSLISIKSSSIPVFVLLAAGLGCDRADNRQQPVTRASAAQSFLSQYEAVGTSGLSSSESKFCVCLFTRTDCPVSNSYAPEVQRMYEKYSPRGVNFYLVYPDSDESPQIIEKHLKEYSYPFSGLRDPKHELVKLAGAKITPEAAVFDASGKLLYRGRIDDRYVDFGKMRLAPTVKDLEQALEAILGGKPAPAAGGPAIGCFIADVK
jgi:thiol-disulfide isomerase/thioredoxin